jgi:hypothetical protein
MWHLIRSDGTIGKSLWENTYKGGWRSDYNHGLPEDEWKCEFDLVANCVIWFRGTEQVRRYEPEQQDERPWVFFRNEEY